MQLRSIAIALVAVTAVAVGPTTAAAGPALLFDAASGKVLYSEDQDHLWHPASLTKIMTAYLVFEALKAGRLTPGQKITVSEKANAQAPSKIGLAVGAEITVDLALQAVIVKSANDASMMLAEAIAGSEEAFVRLMNDTARRLGMTKTVFVNPNGLPAAEQVTTARDLARLARAVLRDFPDRAPLWAQAEVQVGKNKMRSSNALLRTFDGADGMKTGFICDSGFNLVATATRDGRKLVAVVLGDTTSRDRNVRAASLLDHGFQAWDWKQMFNSTTIDTLPPSADAKGIQSIRATVETASCGNRKRPAPGRKKKGQAVAASTGKAKAGEKGKGAEKAKAAPAKATPKTGARPASGETQPAAASGGAPAAPKEQRAAKSTGQKQE